jgi:hypothetical protein
MPVSSTDITTVSPPRSHVTGTLIFTRPAWAGLLTGSPTVMIVPILAIWLSQPTCSAGEGAAARSRGENWLSRGELEEMIGELRRVLLPRLTNQPAPDRAQYLLSPILFPVEQPGPRSNLQPHE